MSGIFEEVQLDPADIFVGDVSRFIIFGFLHLSLSTFKTQTLKSQSSKCNSIPT